MRRDAAQVVDRQDVERHRDKGAEPQKQHRRTPESSVDEPPEQKTGAEHDGQNRLAYADGGGGDPLHEELTRIGHVALEQQRSLERPQPEDRIDSQPGRREQQDLLVGCHSEVSRDWGSRSG